MAGDAAGLAAAPDPAPKVNTLLLLLAVAPNAVAPPNWKPPKNTAGRRNINLFNHLTCEIYFEYSFFFFFNTSEKKWASKNAVPHLGQKRE